MTLLLGFLFGFLQGIRHAFEPDHVVAVSTMITHQKTARARVTYAAAWGVGHAAMLILVGGTLMFVRTELPARLDAAFEVAVSLMLITLGVRALTHAVRRARGVLGERSPHRGDGGAHAWRAVGPLAMGMVHGLAGSGALTAVVVARLPSPFAGLVFMVLFGAGATLGMALLAGAAGLPLTRALRTRWGLPLLLGAAGSVSLALGVAWLAPAVMRFATQAFNGDPCSVGRASLVRELRGQAGATVLSKIAGGISRCEAGRVKRETLTTMECESKANTRRVLVTMPGVIRGFDAMYIVTRHGTRYACCPLARRS